MSHTDPSPAQITAHMYTDSYNEPDLTTKRQMLSDSFDSSGEFCSRTQVLGFEDVFKMTSDAHENYRMEIVGDVSEHHVFAMFRFQFVELATGETTTGTDFCHIGSDGRLSKVVVFFD